MKRIIASILCLLALVAFAGNDKKCRHNDHDKHCNRCCPPPRSVYVTNTVHVTNTVLVTRNCPNVASADFHLQQGHRYNLLVAFNGGCAQQWWSYCSRSNGVIRIVLPSAQVRSVEWWLLDRTANSYVQPRDIDCDVPTPTWWALGKGRVLRSRE